MSEQPQKLRIVVGGDDGTSSLSVPPVPMLFVDPTKTNTPPAGFEYKSALTTLLEKHPLVESVTDVGPLSSSDKTAYPHYAVDAAKKIKAGEAHRGLLICGTHLPFP
jgi:hypothetical protein